MENWIFRDYWQDLKWCSHFEKQFLKILNTDLSYNLVMSSPRYKPPPKTKIYIHTQTSAQMFIAALFTTAKNYKHYKYPYLHQLMNAFFKMWYTLQWNSV